MILRSKKTIGMPLKYKKRSTKVSSHISSPQAKNIPDEVIKIVLDYLDFKDPINKIYNSKKNAELTSIRLLSEEIYKRVLIFLSSN